MSTEKEERRKTDMTYDYVRSLSFVSLISPPKRVARKQPKKGEDYKSHGGDLP